MCRIYSVSVSQVKKLGGLNAYFAGDESSSNPSLLLITDIYGFERKNVRLLADKFAAAGAFMPQTLFSVAFQAGQLAVWEAWLWSVASQSGQPAAHL